MESTKRRFLKLSVLLLCLLLGMIALKPTTSYAAGKKGWSTSQGRKYYYKSGRKVRGYQKIGKNGYYFDLNTGAMLKKKWRRINNRYYYFMANGRMARKRWIKNTYYVDRHGKMVKNRWIGKHFVGENGKRIPNFKGGWKKISGRWYYYTRKGKKRTGWITYKGKRYYLNKNGVRVTSKQKINNKTYHFTSGGALQSSGWIKIGRWYYYANSKGILNTQERMNAPSISRATEIVYKSRTLHVSIKKYRNYSTDYWVAHVKNNNPRQLVHAMAHGRYGGTMQTTSSAVKANNAIIGINGSAFNGSGVPSPLGMFIQNGKIYGNYMTSYTVMSIMKNGTLTTAKQGLWGKALLRQGVRDTLNFGPVLLQNGKTVSLRSQGDPNGFESLRGPYSRTAIGMKRPGEYVMLVADKKRSGSLGLNSNQMISIFRSYGCSYAYNLDGGGSATMSYKGHVLNRPSDGRERPCADFILFKN